MTVVVLSIFIVAGFAMMFIKKDLGLNNSENKKNEKIELKNAGFNRQTVLYINKGTVEIKKNRDDSNFVTAESGEKLEDGYIVRTLDDSRATIIFPNEIITRLDENSEIEIKSSSFSDKSSQVFLYQSSGKSWNFVEGGLDLETNYEIETPRSVASVRGTIFSLSILDDRDLFFGVKDKVDLKNRKLWQEPEKTVFEDGCLEISESGFNNCEESRLRNLKESKWFSWNSEFDKKAFDIRKRGKKINYESILELRTELEDCKEEIRSLESVIDSLREKVELRKVNNLSSINTDKPDCSEDKKKAEELAKKVRILTDENLRLKKQSSALESENRKLNEKLSYLESELLKCAAKEQGSITNLEIESLKHQLESCESDKIAIQEKVRKLESEIESLKKQIENLNQSIKSLHERNARLYNNLSGICSYYEYYPREYCSNYYLSSGT